MRIDKLDVGIYILTRRTGGGTGILYNYTVYSIPVPVRLVKI